MQINSKTTKKSSKPIEKLATHKINLKYTLKNEYLLTIRIISLLFLFSYLIWFIIEDKATVFEISIKYFTHWCYILTLSYFIWTTFFFPDKKITSKCSFIIHVILIINLVVTILYWAVIFWTTDRDSVYQYYGSYFLHIFPILSSTADFVFNRFHLKYGFSIFVVIGVYFGYIFVNCLFTLLDSPVYSVVTYKSVMSYVYLFSALVIAIGGWFLFMFLQRLRFVVVIGGDLEGVKGDLEHLNKSVEGNLGKKNEEIKEKQPFYGKDNNDGEIKINNN